MDIFINKKIFYYIIGVISLIIVAGILFVFSGNKKDDTYVLYGTVLESSLDFISIKDENDIMYTFKNDDIKAEAGMQIVIEYTGILDASKKVQDSKIVNYSVSEVSNENKIPSAYLDNGIFSDYYNLAYDKLKNLSLDEKIGQLLLVRYPDSNPMEILKNKYFAGYVFYEKDFRDKTKAEVLNMMNNLQSVSNIPILTAVDEEGGKVVRVSSNPNLRDSKFKSSQELYASGGLSLIKEDVKDKSKLLKSLGINLNLAPVVDVSTNSSDYMYERTIGENTDITSQYAKAVIEASKGTGVSYTLKHFPGYGNNADTHTGVVTDTRTLDDIRTNDLPPFEAGISVGAEAVLVSHNIVSSIDPDNPASLSKSVHDLLRDDLSFTGVIITDDLAMGATSNITDVTVKAIKAGNDLIITTDYDGSINSIKSALNDGTLTIEEIDKAVFRVLAWKYYKGLMFENQK